MFMIKKATPILVELETKTIEAPKKFTVEDVHREFETASEVLLAEAQEQLGLIPNVNTGKAKRLQAMGFFKTKEVALMQKTNEQKNKLEKRASDLVYYAKKYPQYKFITKDKIMEIAQKYNLVLGSISDFTGFVPEVKLTEIEKFICNIPVAQSDMEIRYNTSSFQSFMWETSRGLASHSPETSYNRQLEIVAPQKDFDMTGKYVEGREIKSIPVPDPIVLFPVREGYLIISKWGEEASDPEVINENHN